MGVSSPNQETEQHSEHFLCGGRYASCVHAGGLSCYNCEHLIMFLEYRIDRQDLHLSGLEAFSFDYVVKWPVSLVLNRKVKVTKLD